METNCSNIRPGSIAIAALDGIARMRRISRDDIAACIGTSRQTVTARMSKRSMLLDDYVDTARAVGADPVETLAHAVRIADGRSRSAGMGE